MKALSYQVLQMVKFKANKYGPSGWRNANNPSLLAGLAAIFIYITFRFEFSFAIALPLLLYDLAIVIGITVLLERAQLDTRRCVSNYRWLLHKRHHCGI